MRLHSRFTIFVLAAATLTIAGCVTHSDLNAYATKGDLATLRSELMTEIKQAQDTAQKAEQDATSAAESAQTSAASAAAASEKADAIFRQSLRK